MPRFVTYEEASRALPDVERIIRRLRRVRDEALGLRTRLEGLWAALEREEASLETIAAEQRRLDALQEEFAALVDELERHGAILRDLDLGLVDFLSLAGQVQIYLCWRVGEHEIRYWHGLAEGYAGRKPLSALPGRRRH